VGESVKLRRTVWAIVFGWGYGLLLLVTAGILLAIGIAQSDFGLLVGAAVCVVLWGLDLARSAHIRSANLTVRRLLLPDQRFPVSAIDLVEVGRREEAGWPGYRGFVLAVECAGLRTVIGPSHYCGRSRLDEWAGLIDQHSDFQGAVRSTADLIQGSS